MQRSARRGPAQPGPARPRPARLDISRAKTRQTLPRINVQQSEQNLNTKIFARINLFLKNRISGPPLTNVCTEKKEKRHEAALHDTHVPSLELAQSRVNNSTPSAFGEPVPPNVLGAEEIAKKCFDLTHIRKWQTVMKSTHTRNVSTLLTFGNGKPL